MTAVETRLSRLKEKHAANRQIHRLEPSKNTEGKTRKGRRCYKFILWNKACLFYVEVLSFHLVEGKPHDVLVNRISKHFHISQTPTSFMTGAFFKSFFLIVFLNYRLLVFHLNKLWKHFLI